MTAVRVAGGVVVLALLAALALARVETVLGELRPVAGTGHDVASPGTPTCAYCHIKKDADVHSIWEAKPPVLGFLSGLKRLCFSCHDGTVTDVGVYVFEPTRPEHVRVPGVRGQDCDRCHDAHGPRQEEFGFFLKLPGAADMCRNCHESAGPDNHPTDTSALAAGVIPADTRWDPSTGDYTGTRLWNPAGTDSGDFIKCLTCHGPHGGYPGTAMLTVGFPAATAPSLCQSCHFRQGQGVE